ncbi:MAG TPA: hypothetical protein VMB79_03335 [Jatrophihabitans sp.]|nr:hypothetical protein [Jatrophihabitans sp.]
MRENHDPAGPGGTDPAAPGGIAPEGTEAGTDLEYDLAHEAAEIDADACSEDSPEPVTQVANRTEAYDGDYGYDLAHELPEPARPPGHRPRR